MFLKKIKSSQAILEYSILLALIIAALLIMHLYIKRAYQGRIRREADGLGQQYAPGHTSSKTVTTTTSNSITYTGGTTSVADNPAGGDALVATDGAQIEDGTSVSVSRSKTTFKSGEQVDTLGSEINP
jgi:hypothetical protein